MSGLGSRSTRFVVVSADERAILDRLYAEAEWPRQDVVELAEALDAELLSYSDLRGASWITRVLACCAGKPVALAWLAFRKAGTFYFANAENTALPLALLLKLRPNSTLVFCGHRLTTWFKTRAIKAFNLLRQADAVFCYCRVQERHLLEGLGMPADRVRRIEFQVDERFFAPLEGPVTGTGVLSVGREMRDYATLFAALGNTALPVTIVASSPWSRRRDRTHNAVVPANVTVLRGVSNSKLRELYRNAAVAVVPLANVDFAAGVTALLEAHACGKPVVATASEGIADTLHPDSDVAVPCRDAVALRAAVLRLIERPDEAARLGERGRARILRERTLARWVSGIARECGEIHRRKQEREAARRYAAQ